MDGRLAMLMLFGRGRGQNHLISNSTLMVQSRDSLPKSVIMDLQLVYPELCVNVHKLLAAGGLASSSGRLVCLERSEGFFINVDRKSP